MFRNPTYSQRKLTCQIGKKWTVLPVLSDKVIPHSNGSTVDYWLASIIQSTDYSLFGVQLENRTLSKSGVTDFTHFGFQNQEEDPETGLVNYKYRMHDPRLGRFFAIDPLATKYPHNSVYAFSENRVIDGVELEGLEVHLQNSPPEGSENSSELRGNQISGTALSISPFNGPLSDSFIEDNKIIPDVTSTTDMGLSVRIHVIHGSVPLNEEGGNKTAGGKLGGHVYITLGSQQYGFSNNTHNTGDVLNVQGGHVFDSESQPNSLFENQSIKQFTGIYGGSYGFKQLKRTVIDIEISAEQVLSLYMYYCAVDGATKTPDYDYSVLGWRCASSAADALNQAGVINIKSPKREASTPKEFRKLMKNNGFKLLLQSKGTKNRRWY